MTSEHPARAPKRNILTGARLALAALTFSLLAVALSSSCNPTDSSRDGSTKSPTPLPPPAAAKVSPPQPSSQIQPAAKSSPSAANALSDEQLNTAMTTLDGKPLKLSDLKGKVVIINAWATWCGPCRKEIPDFIKIQEDYEGRGVEVIGLTSEDERNTAEAVRKFVKDFKINYRVVWVDEAGWGAFLMPSGSIPQTYILGQDGRLLEKFRGYSPQVAFMSRDIIEEALNNPSTGGVSTDKTAK